jgi:acyl-CoA synthetase (AMP-forming)/AMP-acid ligase II
MHRGNLYIAGRSKDLIIIRGRNYAPQEIEELAAQAEGVRPWCVVAASQVMDEESGEQLLVLAEKDARSKLPDEEIAAGIRQKIIAGIGLTPYHVQILEHDTLPRTSSGKLRRSDALRLFLAGELVPPEKMGALKLLREIGKSQVAWGRFWLRGRAGE